MFLSSSNTLLSGIIDANNIIQTVSKFLSLASEHHIHSLNYEIQARKLAKKINSVLVPGTLNCNDSLLPVLKRLLIDIVYTFPINIIHSDSYAYALLQYGLEQKDLSFLDGKNVNIKTYHKSVKCSYSDDKNSSNCPHLFVSPIHTSASTSQLARTFHFNLFSGLVDDIIIHLCDSCNGEETFIHFSRCSPCDNSIFTINFLSRTDVIEALQPKSCVCTSDASLILSKFNFTQGSRASFCIPCSYFDASESKTAILDYSSVDVSVFDATANYKFAAFVSQSHFYDFLFYARPSEPLPTYLCKNHVLHMGKKPFNQTSILFERSSISQSVSCIGSAITELHNSRIISHEVKTNVSVIICTHNSIVTLIPLLMYLVSDSSVLEVIIVSNNTSSDVALKALSFLSGFSEDKPSIRVLVSNEPFNFSRMCNRAALSAEGEFLFFLNDDICSASPLFISSLVRSLEISPQIGVAGSILVYPDATIQHAGIDFEAGSFEPYHLCRGKHIDDVSTQLLCSHDFKVLALTGGSMMTKLSLFQDMGGFDEQLPTIYQDVDFCLRIAAHGKWCVISPQSFAIHHESLSIKPTLISDSEMMNRSAQHSRFHKCWNKFLASLV